MRWPMGRSGRRGKPGTFLSTTRGWPNPGGGEVGACLLGYPAEETPGPIDPDTPAIFIPLLAPGSWYLNVLATYEAFRGRGLGSALLAYAEKVARDTGHREISLIAADTHREALHLYAAKGFREVAHRAVVKQD